MPDCELCEPQTDSLNFVVYMLPALLFSLFSTVWSCSSRRTMEKRVNILSLIVINYFAYTCLVLPVLFLSSYYELRQGA